MVDVDIDNIDDDCIRLDPILELVGRRQQRLLHLPASARGDDDDDVLLLGLSEINFSPKMSKSLPGST